MNYMNGQMPTRIINEISISRGMGMLGDSEIYELNEGFGGVLDINNLSGLNISEIEELKLKVKVKLEDVGLRLDSNAYLRKLREEVKGIMWGYYLQNKLNLSVDIGDFREEIIVELMKGVEVKDVFEWYRGRDSVKVA